MNVMMWLSVWISLLLSGILVHAAIDLDGFQIVDPVTEDDPSPIADPITYHPDQHDCPLPCIDYTNVHMWTPYFSVDRLQRCEKPMLLQFSVSHSLGDPNNSLLIRSCTLGSDSSTADRTIANATSVQIDNPKKADNLVENSLDVSPACASDGTRVDGKLALSTSSGGGTVNGAEIASLLAGMRDFFNAKNNCDEIYLFAYHKKTVASVYLGPGLGKPTVASALEVITNRLKADSAVANATVAQICSKGSKPETILGVSIDGVSRNILVPRCFPFIKTSLWFFFS